MLAMRTFLYISLKLAVDVDHVIDIQKDALICSIHSLLKVAFISKQEYAVSVSFIIDVNNI